MDLTKLAGTLLSSDSINGLSSLTGASGGDITNVLTQALPSLLNGAKDQAKDKNTTDSFVAALAQHAKDDTNDLSKFMGKVDLKDGSKILTHLLGSNKENLLADIAKKTGVSQKETANILSGMSPLLMSLMGKQAQEDDDKDSGIEKLLGSLVDNVDIGDLIGNFMNNNSSGKKDGNLLGNILNNFLN